jgi:hypothetical protein
MMGIAAARMVTPRRSSADFLDLITGLWRSDEPPGGRRAAPPAQLSLAESLDITSDLLDN